MIFATVALGLVALHWLLTLRAWRQRGIPGPVPLPLVGNNVGFLLSDNYTEYFGRFRPRYGDVALAALMNRWWVILSELDAAMAVFRRSTRRMFLVGGVNPRRFGFRADPLFNKSGHAWASSRKLVQPLFGPKNVQRLWPCVAAAADALVCDDLLPTAGDSGHVVDIQAAVQRAVFRVACEATCGLQLAEADVPEVTQAFQRIVTVMLLESEFPARAWLPNPRLHRAVALIRGLLMAKVDEYLQLSPEALEERADVLARLVAASEEGAADREVLFSELFQYLFAMYDTSTSSLGYFFYVIGQERNREAQRRVRAEVCALEAGDLGALRSAPLLCSAIKESQRLHPVTPVLDRELTEDVQLPNGMLCRKGDVVLLQVTDIQREPAVWGADAGEFRVDRFCAGELSERQRASSVWFGAGLKNCVGFQLGEAVLAIVAGTVLRRFRVELDPGYRLKYVDSMVVAADRVPVRLFSV